MIRSHALNLPQGCASLNSGVVKMSKPEPLFTAIVGRDFTVALSVIVCRVGLVLLLLCAVVVSTFGQTSVLTQHNDNARTGQNTSETILNATNVNVNQFGKLFAMPANGQVYAQPLYVPGVTINGGVHNVVIIATENDSVYAYDADSNGAPLWKVSMVDVAHGAGMGETALDSATTIGCSDMQPQIGITSTPVIDPTSKTIYLEAKSTDGTNYFHRLHALDLLTGSEKTPGPVVIAGTVSGTGDGSSNGQLVFNSNNNALHQLNRPGLLLLNGTIYIAYGSHCDASPWHGWLFAYDAGTFTQKSVYVTTPNGGLGGFWMTGAGIAADTSGNIFIASGNGDFDTTNVPATETGDTILKLGTMNQVLTLLDYFTPYNQLNLDNTDTDLGSGGVVLLPDQPGQFPHILVQAGKEGRIYVVNRDQMTTNNSHYCSGCANDPEIIEETGRNAAGIGEGMFNTAAYWNNTLYFWGVQDVLQSIPITNGLPDFTHSTGSSPQIGLPGAGVSVSSNGTTAGSAIVWAIDSTQFGSPGPGPGPAVLYAYDATNILTMLYSSAQNVTRDAAGNAVKFAVPTVVNGKVYVGTSTEVDVYGLLSTNPPPSISSITPSNAAAGGPSFQLTLNGTGFAAGATVNFGSSPAITPSSINSGQIVATIPAADIATAGVVNVTVTNVGGGGTSNALTFSINPAPTAPVITSANSTAFTVGTAGSFTVTTTGSPTPSLTETGTLPSPVTFKDNGNGTATLSGTPAAGTAGSYPITIKASNGVGTAASQSFTLTVNGSGGGGSNFAYVAGSVTGVNNWGSTSGTTVSVALHQSPKAGDLLLCAANWQSGTATASMSDPNNGTWKPIGSAKAGIATNAAFSGQMFYVPSAVSASTTVTLTVNSPVAFRAFECAEYSYSGTIAFDGTPQYSTTPASKGVATISGLTTLNSSDLVFAACLGVTTTCTTGSGYTGLDDKNTFNVTSGSFGNSFVGLNGQMIQYKIAATAGAQSATFGTGTANDDVTLGLVAMTASQVNQAPTITSANSTTFTMATAGSFTVTATGSPAPLLTESGALPNLVTFKDNGNGTATLSGTPAAGTAGSYPITIKASNGVGTAASQSFTLTVNGSGGGGSGFAYVAGSVTGVNNWGSTSGTTVSVALHQSPKAGDLLLCAANWQSGTATASMSDPNNGTWKPIGSAKAGIATNAAFSGQMFYVPSAVSASTTVTLTVNSPVAFRAFECAEYSYSGTIAFDGTPQYSTTPASKGVATISGLTTLNSSDLVFAACLGVTTTCTTGSGYTGLDDKNTFDVTSGSFGNSFVGLNGQMIQYKIAATAGAQSATFGTGTANDDVTLGLVAF